MRRLRLESRAKAWQHLGQSPEGRAASGPTLLCPPLSASPGFKQPALHRAVSPHTPGPAHKSEMNLDTLFQQIQLTEKQAGEKRRLIQQGQPHGRHLACPMVSVTVNAPSIFQSIPTKVGWHHCEIMRGVVLEKLFRQTSRDFLPMPLLCKNRTFTHLLTGFLCFTVKFDINKYHEKTNQMKEELNSAKIKLETKVSRNVYSTNKKYITFTSI